MFSRDETKLRCHGEALGCRITPEIAVRRWMELANHHLTLHGRSSSEGRRSVLHDQPSVNIQLAPLHVFDHVKVT